MKIGNYQLLPIETSRFALDGGAMFGVVPQVIWRKTNPPDEFNRISMVTRSLLIQGEGKNILVDTGNSNKIAKRFQDIYKIDFTSVNLISSLQKHNISPSNITDVILTHLHFDHAGGSTYNDNGIIKPTFPNAKYYVQKDHLKLALNPTERDRASFLHEDFVPLQEHGVMELVEGEFEIFPGIHLILVHGHTNSQQLVKVSDDKNTMLFGGDLIPMSAHVPLPFIMGYDLRPLVTLEEKKKILGPAYEEKWAIFFEHDPNTIAGTVTSNEKGFIFESPIQLDK
ncbi:MAG: MBL fold metallo-hydrolase [Bacteroidota bacterium]|nr:MBL fold metallo-hydrolase [Bacteroidota bacterium]